jgi:hypothetical protein
MVPVHVMVKIVEIDWLYLIKCLALGALFIGCIVAGVGFLIWLLLYHWIWGFVIVFLLASFLIGMGIVDK